MVEGSVKSDQKDTIDTVKQEAAKIISDVNPKTCQIDISCKVGAGGDYIEIDGVVDIHNEEEKSIKHKSG